MLCPSLRVKERLEYPPPPPRHIHIFEGQSFGVAFFVAVVAVFMRGCFVVVFCTFLLLCYSFCFSLKSKWV